MNKIYLLFLLLPQLFFGQITPNKVTSFSDLKWLIDNEGFIEKNSFLYTGLKGTTKADVLNALYLDDSGIINSKTNNQLVIRNDLVKPVGGIKAIMRTDPGDFNETQNDMGVPSIHILHDGVFDLPEIGDFLYNEDGTAFTSTLNDSYYGIQLYPGASDEVNYRINYQTGEIIWVGWTVDRTSTPTGVTSTNGQVGAFTLSWYGHSRYFNIRYYLERKRILPSPESVFTVQRSLDNSAFTDGLLYTESFTSQNKAYWRVRAIATSSGNHVLFDKVSSEIIVTPNTSNGYYIGDTSQSSIACTSAPSFNEKYTTASSIATISVGDYFYTDANLTTVLNGGSRWWRSEGGSYSFKIESNGYISGIANNC